MAEMTRRPYRCTACHREWSVFTTAPYVPLACVFCGLHRVVALAAMVLQATAARRRAS